MTTGIVCRAYKHWVSSLTEECEECRKGADMSIKDGPGEGSWSVFAQKVVAERDELKESLQELVLACEGIVQPFSYKHQEECRLRIRDTLTKLKKQKENSNANG